MKDRRCIEPDVSSLGNTHRSATKRDDLVSIVDRDPPIQMGAGRDKERCIGGWNVIKVRTQGDHPRQQVEWWSNMVQAALDGPGTKTRGLAPVLYADCPVLMPSEGPVRFLRLVEQDRPDRFGERTEDRSGNGTDTAIMHEQWSERFDAVQPQASLALPERGQCRLQGVEAWLQLAFKKLRTIRREVISRIFGHRLLA